MTRGSTTAYAYDRADRILAAGATSYTVDAKGNTTGRGADRFGYDQANRLVSGTVGGEASAYAYDGDGKRASKTVDGNRTEYVYDVNRALAVVLEDGARKYVWGLGLAYAEDEETGEIAVYHTDGLGSVRAITNADGAVVQTYRTDEYGVPVADSGAIAQPFQYTGEQRDEETGFVYLRARMYEPEIGRFLQRDVRRGTNFEPQRLNRYAYSVDNPVTISDATGMEAHRSMILRAASVGGESPTGTCAVPLLPIDWRRVPGGFLPVPNVFGPWLCLGPGELESGDSRSPNPVSPVDVLPPTAPFTESTDCDMKCQKEGERCLDDARQLGIPQSPRDLFSCQHATIQCSRTGRFRNPGWRQGLGYDPVVQIC
ncbi:MAG TPA: RHS repeat-associated core domain-containing protein [Chloroflexota bacterium]|nr:RHS repeat-associated core domain-containing protein [Chloroflexota bacterium]